jgi:flagellar biosynthesis GTPase FlhF
MPDIKNFIKKAKKLEKIEKIAEAGKEIGEGEAERAPEKKVEISRPSEVFEVEEGEGGAEAAPGFAAGQNLIQRRKEREKQIESILAKDLEEIYLNMPPDKQEEFKREGEKTAREINSLLEKTKVKVKKIIDLIKKWLSIIPGVNRFFLEQESKIKADEIVKLKMKK